MTKQNMKVKIVGSSFLMIIFLVLNSCSVSYKFEGGSINYDLVKTILVHDFPNRSANVYPPLAPAFDRELKNRYIEQTRLNAVSNNPDIEISGEITGYDIMNTAVTGADAYATKARLTITVRVQYTNHKNSKEDIDQSFSAFREYDSVRSLDEVQDQLIDQIVKELVEKDSFYQNKWLCQFLIFLQKKMVKK